MADESCPEAKSLFEDYRARYRAVFLEHTLIFIRGFGIRKEDLADFRRAVRTRRDLLRSEPRKRGRPRGSRKPSPPMQTEEANELFDPHGAFRELSIVCGDFGHLRPVFCRQVSLFIQEANLAELAAIRRAVARREKAGWYERRGQPGVFKDDRVAARALRAVWMRYVERKRQTEVSRAVGMPDNSPVAKGTSVRRLEDYFAAKIYNAFQPDWQVHVGPGQYQVKPGILDDRTVQAYLRSQTGLPFNTHPEECKRIVTELWPRTFSSYWKQIERVIARRRKVPPT